MRTRIIWILRNFKNIRFGNKGYRRIKVMETDDLILGLFFSDENNLVYEKLRFDEKLSKDSKEQLKMLSFKFLGPVFLTSASAAEGNWKIEFIEADLSLDQKRSGSETSVIQSFFNLNSSIETREGITNLFAFIGSPYTEDVKLIYDKMVRYIHPSIIQGIALNQKLNDQKKLSLLLNDEINRGINLIEYSLGSSRKMYWEGEQKYYCIGVIERKNSEDKKICNLYTIDESDPLRSEFLKYFPSYYVMSILPDYYENLVNETLTIFDKKGIFSTIRRIDLRLNEKKVLYLEEFVQESNTITSYGVILVPDNGDNIFTATKSLSSFKKSIRKILDDKKELKIVLKQINPKFITKTWSALSNEELDKIRGILDA